MKPLKLLHHPQFRCQFAAKKQLHYYTNFMDAILNYTMEKPLLLKDYLLDDMSSCSSNGFNSFPRRQCCIDLTCKKQKNDESKSKFAMTALHAVIAAVKRLPFSTNRSLEKKMHNPSTFVPLSFSLKLLKKKSNIWKRKPDQKDIGRCKHLDQVMEVAAQTSDHSRSSLTTSESKRNSSSGSDFTVAEDCSSASFYSEVKSDKNVVVQKLDSASNDYVSTESVACSCSSASPNGSTITKTQSSESKEQFSPVSVLDPGFDDEDEVSSTFQHRLARMEGTKKKLMKKIQMFESLAKLEASNVAKRLLLHQDSDNHSSTSIDETLESDIEENEDQNAAAAEYKAIELLHQMKAISPSYKRVIKLKAEKLLNAFFRESIANGSGSLLADQLIQEAMNWINAECRKMEFDVQNNKQGYVKDMEKLGQWRKWEQENQEVDGELASEIFEELLNELVLDMASLE